MGKTRKDRRDKYDFYDEGRRGRRRDYKRNSNQDWKRYGNASADEVIEDYEHKDDMVGDD